MEPLSADLWKWRADKLQRLGITSDPRDPRAAAADLAGLRAELHAACAENIRLREALAMAMAADDAGEDHARA